jgi:hypothetical protein
MIGGCGLYRHFDADRVLLYIGISENPVTRARDHAAGSIWAQFAVHWEGTWHTTRDLALAAERDAIISEKPLFNKQHANYDKQPTIDYLARQIMNPRTAEVSTTSHQLTVAFTCVQCKGADLVFDEAHDWIGDNAWEMYHHLRCNLCGAGMWGMAEFGDRGQITVAVWDTDWAPGPPFGILRIMGAHRARTAEIMGAKT